MRRPLSRAAITLLSLTTSASPGRSRSGRSRDGCGPQAPAPRPAAPPAAAPRRAGSPAASAMRSAGSSKSKRSVRMAVIPGVAPKARLGSMPREVTRSRVRRSGVPDDEGPHAPIVALTILSGFAHRLAALDLVDVFHALDDVAPGGVLVVEEAGVVEADEELAVAGIRAGRARHRHGAAHMRLLVELGLELLARAAGAGALAGSRSAP